MKRTQTRSKKQAAVVHPKTARQKLSHYAVKVFVPHPKNNYRPHLIRVHGLTIVLVLILAMQFFYTFAVTGRVNILGKAATIQTADLYNETNKARKTEGLPDLALNDQLNQAAYLKAQDMIEAQYWAHTSPSGVQPWKWFGDVGYNYSVAGENLAKNYPTAQAAVSAWMDSPTHRANVLNKNYVDVGFAVVEGSLDNEDTTLIVAMYGAPATVAAVQSQAANQLNFSAPVVAGTVINPAEYVVTSLLSLSIVSKISLVLLALVGVVALLAHHYRKELPKAWQKSWRVHHGLYTLGLVLVVGTLIVVTAGGGSI